MKPVTEFPHLTAFHAAIGVERVRQPELGALYYSTLSRMGRITDDLVDRSAKAGRLGPETNQQAVADVLYALLRGLTELSASVPGERHHAALVSTQALITGQWFVFRVAARTSRARSRTP